VTIAQKSNYLAFTVRSMDREKWVEGVRRTGLLGPSEGMGLHQLGSIPEGGREFSGN